MVIKDRIISQTHRCITLQSINVRKLAKSAKFVKLFICAKVTFYSVVHEYDKRTDRQTTLR